MCMRSDLKLALWVGNCNRNAVCHRTRRHSNSHSALVHALSLPVRNTCRQLTSEMCLQHPSTHKINTWQRNTTVTATDTYSIYTLFTLSGSYVTGICISWLQRQRIYTYTVDVLVGSSVQLQTRLSGVTYVRQWRLGYYTTGTTSNSNQLVSRSAMAAGQLITHRACMRAPVSPDTRQATDVLGRRARSGRRSRGPRPGEHTSIGTPVLPSADPIIRSIQPAPRRAGRQRRRQANRYRRTGLTALQ